jgi:hypothetical protein
MLDEIEATIQDVLRPILDAAHDCMKIYANHEPDFADAWHGLPSAGELTAVPRKGSPGSATDPDDR